MISNDRVGPAVRSLLGLNPSDAEIQRYITQFDRDGKGKIDFADFMSLTAQLLHEGNSQEELIEAFKYFDRNNSGTIPVKDLRLVMVNLGDKLTSREADEIMKEGDLDKNGEVNYEKFVKLMMSK